MTKPAIICVDDDATVLESLKIELKRILSDQCLIETAEDGEEALELLAQLKQESHDVALVMADYIMPGIRGDELLKQVHSLSPCTLTIMVTGQADLQAVSNAVRHAKLYRYIAKPWNAEDLELTVVEAVHSYLQDRKIESQNLKLKQTNLQLEQAVADLHVVEQALRESQHQMASITAHIPGAVFRRILHGEGQVSFPFISPGMLALTGLSPNEIEANPNCLMNLIHPQDRQEYAQKIREALTALEDFCHEYRIISTAGELKWVQESARLWRMASGDVVFDGVSLDISDRKRAEEAAQRFQFIIEQSSDLTYWLRPDQNYRFSYANPALCRFIGYSEAELLQKAVPEMALNFCQGDCDLVWEKVKAESFTQFETSITHKDGTEIPIEVTANYVECNGVQYAAGQMRDLRDRKRAEQALRESQERLMLAVDAACLVVWDWDLLTKQAFWSGQVDSLFGRQMAGDQPSPERIMELVYPDDQPLLLQTLKVAKQEQTLYSHDFRITGPDGNCRHVSVKGKFFYDAQNTPIRMIGIMMDISDRKLTEAQLLEAALRDGLTGLANRTLLIERVEHALQRYQRQPENFFSVLFLDIDGFKVVNDNLGHPVGDQLLIEIAQRLKGCVRLEDTVARLGGDEFVILLEGIQEPAHALQCAERIQNALSTSFDLGGVTVQSGTSIGIALANVGYSSADELLRDADTAMYKAKSSGRGRCEIFTTSSQLESV
jgi:diguanylate cyclase (GGDEF)-like protein/PAS domain S-box-containing protein